MKQIILTFPFLLLLGCDETRREKYLENGSIANNTSVANYKTNTIIKVTLSKVDSVFYIQNNIEHVLDDEKDSIIITADKYDPYIYSKTDLQKILTYFPILNDSLPRNPDDSYNFSGIWKRYLDSSGIEHEISFSSEAGQDAFYQLYAYFLKKKFSKNKLFERRKNLSQIYNDINNIFAELSSGGTYFGHQARRIPAYVEYAIFCLNRFDVEKKYDINPQKQLFICSLKQIVSDEISIQDDTFTTKEKENRKLEMFKKADEIGQLIIDQFYLKMAQQFQYSHY